MSKLVYGVGVNDAEYVVTKKETISYFDGKQKRKLVWACPYYSRWTAMLSRCYSKKLQVKFPTYIGCTVHRDWLYLSNFTKWVDQQPNRDWINCNLDKDFILEGNKIYSPDTCVFINSRVNVFIIDRSASRGNYLIGVYWNKKDKKFMAHCRDPFKINSAYVGSFDTELEAHLAWKVRKHEYSLRLADLQTDERVAEVLRTKYKD
jgi:hypothetical protein